MFEALDSMLNVEERAAMDLVPNAIANEAAFTAKAAYDAGVETVTSGACSVAVRTTLLSVTGTKAYTVANGVTVGQVKVLACTVAASTPAGTVTPTTAVGFTSLAFSAVGSVAVMQWTVSGWVLLSLDLMSPTNLASLQTFPSLLTVLTNAQARDTYDAGIETVTSGACSITKRTTRLSITGTQAYAVADGTTVGQVKVLSCSVAASTPAGTVTPTTGSGFTSLAFDAVNDCAVLQWSAVGWIILSLNGVTAS